MAMRLADRLTAARRRRFVGRIAERNLFIDALSAPEPPFSLLYVSGPGGVGKTSLLRELYDVCLQSGTPALYLDARSVEPSPQGFLQGLALLGPHQDALDPWAAFMDEPGRHVLFIDTYELMAPLDGWLRSEFFPQLVDTLVVFAGRDALATGWRTDLGWQDLLRTIALNNLTSDESTTYLMSRDVPPDKHTAIIDFTHGLPLALSLVADSFAQRPGADFQPEADPDVIKALFEYFVQKVPGPAHRAALEACSMVRSTTESLLSAMLQIPDVHDLFDWLRGLSFIESGTHGLFPHDQARETLNADLRWRNPDWFRELHERARCYYYEHLQQTQGRDQLRILFDYVYLHRNSPLVRPYLEWQESSSIFPDAIRESDRSAILSMVGEHEGRASAELAAYWFARQPAGFVVLRGAGGTVTGFLATVALQHTAPEDRQRDPAVAAAWSYLHKRSPLRPGEQATLVRFWMARESYQTVSEVQSLVFISVLRQYVSTSGLAFSFFACAEPDFWAPMFTYTDHQRLPQADFEIGSRRFGVYGHDWRVVPPLPWLDRLGEQDSAAASTQATPLPEPLVVLSQEDFAEEIRCALRTWTSPQQLAASPLLRSRLVNERAGAHAQLTQRVAALQAILREAIEALRESPRESKLYRALEAGILHPALTQEQAAEQIDVPFSTYRRHLQLGMSRVAETLWSKEIGLVR